MTARLVALLTLLFAHGFSAAHGEARAAAPQPPDRRELWVPADQLKDILAKHPNAVLLSREQYETLLRDARRDGKRPAEPPRRATLSSAQYRARPMGKVLQITAQLTVHVATDEWAQLTLPFEGVTLGTMTIDGEAALTADKVIAQAGSGTPGREFKMEVPHVEPAALVLRGRGERTIALELSVPIVTHHGERRVSLRLPSAGATALHIELPPNVRVTGNQPLQVEKVADTTRATISPAPDSPRIDFAWQATGERGAQPLALREQAFFEFRLDAEKLAARWDLTIDTALGNIPASFDIALPPGAKVLRVEGNDLASWSLEAERLRVELQPGERSSTLVHVNLEQPSLGGAAAANVSLPVPSVHGVERVSGSFHFVAEPDVIVKEIATDHVTAQHSAAAAKPTLFSASYTFSSQPAPPRVAVEKAQSRFDADIDTLVQLKPEAVFIERTLTLRPVKGELFTASIALPAGEELLRVRRDDDTEPRWQRDGDTLRLRWSDRGAEPRVFKISTRTEPAKWTQLDAAGTAFTLGDAHIDGAANVTGYIALEADESFRVEAEPSETLERRDGRTTPVRGAYAWFRRKEFTLGIKVAKRPGEMVAALTGYALPLEGALDLRAQISFTFLHSGRRSVRVRVPEPLAAQFHFDGPQIAERNLAGDTWTIVFQKELTGSYALDVSAQVATARDAADASRFRVELPVIEPLDVRNASGTWGIEANTETEIAFTPQGMNELDTLLVPALPGYQPRHRVIGVFGYFGARYALTLAGMRHAPATLATEVVDQLELDSVVSPDGPERHHATYLLRTAGAQFLEVKLAPSSKLLSLAVDDQPQKPIGGGAEELRVQLPAKQRDSATLTISLLYETPRSSWRGRGGHRIVAPVLSEKIPVLRSRWRLFLPEGFEYTGLESNLGEPSVLPPAPLVMTPVRWWRIQQATAILGWRGISDPSALVYSMPEFAVAQRRDDAETAKYIVEEGRKAFEAGRLDEARHGFEQALKADPYNVSANKGLAEVDAASKLYDAQAYNEARSKAVWKLDQAWANPVRRLGVAADSSPTKQQLDRIIIPRIEFREATVREAVDFISRKIAELTGGRGVNIALKLDGQPQPEPRITISLSNIPASEALRYLAQLANLELRFEPGGVVLATPPPPGALTTRSFAFAPEEYQRLTDRPANEAQQALIDNGMAFPPGASAKYLATGKQLVICNTPENLALAESIIASFQPAAEDKPAEALADTADVAGTARISAKLNRIVLPKLEFREASIREAVEFLRHRSRELDTAEPDPAQRGVNIVLKFDEAASIFPAVPDAPKSSDARITISLTNIPLAEALKYVSSLANLKFKVEPHAVALVPVGTPTDVLITKEYQVRPGMIAGPTITGPNDGRVDAKEFLIAQGVPFPQGASATYLAASSRLIVRNTQENLELIDTLVSASADENITAPRPMRQAGLLPVKLDLPKTGEEFVLEGFFAAEHVEFRYEDLWARARRLWFWFLGGAAAFLILGARRPWWRSAWAVLVLTFIPLLLGATAICNAVLAGWLVALVLHRMAARFVFRAEREEEAA